MKFVQFYQENLRFPLFSGFLSLGGFLFAAKTFIVIHMKKELYDTDKYEDRYQELKRLNPHLKKYQPLRNLSQLLFFSVIACLVTSISQLTIGLFSHWFASGFCVAFAIIALALLIYSLFQIRANLKQWMDDLESSSLDRPS